MTQNDTAASLPFIQLPDSLDRMAVGDMCPPLPPG